MQAAAILSTRSVAAPSKLSTSVSSRRFADASGPLKNTKLHDLHVAKGAKMAPFCGWHMPIEYPDGILNSHLHCRQKAGLFDVSHMGQLLLKGADRVKFIESLTVADVAEMPKNEIKLSVFTNEKGGIKDDLMITNAPDHLYVVVNAGCADKDIAHLKDHLASFKKKGGKVDMEVISDRFSLVALQGPSAAGILQALVKEDLKSFYFMNSRMLDVKGVGVCRVGRSGYTGEDGFEISVPHENVNKLTNLFLNHADVRLVGLGARDSLRLESGLCLYGNDIDETTTPVEAQLVWTIGKRRREQGGFLGASVVQQQLKSGVSRKRVGLLLENGIARPGSHENPTPVLDAASGKKIGHVTSGTFSPVLKKGIAMAYIDAKAGPNVKIEVRGKHFNATVTKMPFVKQNYWKKPEAPKK